MRLIYENPVGGAGLLWLVKRKAVSRLYGLYCRTKLSAKSIPQFIEKYGVDMTGCHGKYKNFAQFFAREKTDVVFPEEKNSLGSPCEGLVSVFSNIKPDSVIMAKGSQFSPEELFADSALAREYSGGTMVSIRLTPANYHRMHFFDNGVVTRARMIKGHLYSVSPLALNRVVKLYCRNKRALIQFSTENFGNVVIVEVGATFVGSIVHCFEEGQKVERGDVASYFKPGGSLVLMFLKKDAFKADNELVIRTFENIETKIKVGKTLGASKRTC
jgi:phosphatidylserine decarboxylase